MESNPTITLLLVSGYYGLILAEQSNFLFFPTTPLHHCSHSSLDREVRCNYEHRKFDALFKHIPKLKQVLGSV